jgi:hypothetical protein
MKTLFAGLFLIFAFATIGFAQDNTDFGLWNDVTVTKVINKQFDVLGGVRFDTKKNTSKFNENRVYGGFSYKHGNFTVQPALIILKNFAKLSYYEIRPQLGLSYKIKVTETVAVTPKVRVEYHFKQHLKNDARIVPFVTIEKKLNKKYSIFNTDEFWISNNGKDAGQFRKRFFFGTTRVVNKHLSIDFFYLYQRDEQVRPKNTHKLGLTWKIRV